MLHPSRIGLQVACRSVRKLAKGGAVRLQHRPERRPEVDAAPILDELRAAEGAAIALQGGVRPEADGWIAALEQGEQPVGDGDRQAALGP
ncbi:hypothetical protein SDC9_205984 [bioreactor metagenome]|uniref:Uncharacterized protein n=1 Tax=bioreactor metagenome TaxID=1076179 RepID=A0A645J3S1_9ZZZZ